MKMTSSQAGGILGGWVLFLWKAIKFGFFGTGWSMMMLALEALLRKDSIMNTGMLICGTVITVLMILYMLRKGRTVLLSVIGAGSAVLLLFACEMIPSAVKVILAAAAAALVLVPAVVKTSRKVSRKQKYTSEKARRFQEILEKIPSDKPGFQKFCKAYSREELENMAVLHPYSLFKKMPCRQMMEFIRQVDRDKAYNMALYTIQFDSNGNMRLP